MKLSNTPPSKRTAPDQDLAEQARPGHGIPSQDPEIGAQVSLEPWEAEREANSVLTGGGMMVGAAAGAAIGSVVAGPVGAVVGGTAGAVAGVLGGGAAARRATWWARRMRPPSMQRQRRSAPWNLRSNLPGLRADRP